MAAELVSVALGIFQITIIQQDGKNNATIIRETFEINDI